MWSVCLSCKLVDLTGNTLTLLEQKDSRSTSGNLGSKVYHALLLCAFYARGVIVNTHRKDVAVALRNATWRIRACRCCI